MGYPVVVLSAANGEKRTRRVHRMVALAWLPNPGGLPHINHKNCDRTDARVENLEWCTHAENIAYAYRVGGRRPALAMPASTVFAIRAALSAGELGRDIAARFDVPRSTVSGIRTGRLYSLIQGSTP